MIAMNFVTKFTFQSIYLPFGSKIFETYAFYSIFMQICQAENFKNLFHLSKRQTRCVINWSKFNCCPKQEHQSESRHENEPSRTQRTRCAILMSVRAHKVILLTPSSISKVADCPSGRTRY